MVAQSVIKREGGDFVKLLTGIRINVAVQQSVRTVFNNRGLKARKRMAFASTLNP